MMAEEQPVSSAVPWFCHCFFVAVLTERTPFDCFGKHLTGVSFRRTRLDSAMPSSYDKRLPALDPGSAGSLTSLHTFPGLPGWEPMCPASVLPMRQRMAPVLCGFKNILFSGRAIMSQRCVFTASPHAEGGPKRCGDEEDGGAVHDTCGTGRWWRGRACRKGSPDAHGQVGLGAGAAGVAGSPLPRPFIQIDAHPTPRRPTWVFPRVTLDG